MAPSLYNRSWLALAAGVFLLQATPCRAQEWTRFRGPNGTGISPAKDLPVSYSPEAANWRVALPGTGHSSPVIWGDRVFVTSAEAGTGKQHLLCLGAADGKTLWDRTNEFKPYPHHRLNSFASGTPAVDQDRVYVTWVTPETHVALAYDHAGKEVWKRDLGKYVVNHGGAASPVVVGDLVVIRSDSEEEGAECFVMALDRKTGAPKWKLPRSAKSGSFSTPILYQPKDGPEELIFTSNAHGITSVDPQTGKVNWEQPGVFMQRCVGGPVLANGRIFATAGNGGGERQGVAVEPGSKSGGATAKIAFQTDRRYTPYVPTPLVVGERLFLWGDGGIVTCLNANTGELVWNERVGGTYFGSPVSAGGKIYILSAKGELVVIEAADQFKVLGRSDLGEASHSTPAISGGRLYLRTEGHLISLGGKK